MVTIAEREAELADLQAAFDEYISSSRELEEELDAELAKMQEKLAESSAANAALSGQLENMAPQLASLETALMESRQKLELEQKLRRQAELVADDAEARAREAEGQLGTLREENDAAHEEVAFLGSELEETRLELEVERERYRVELEELQQDLEVMEAKVANRGGGESSAATAELLSEMASVDDELFSTSRDSSGFIDENGFPAETFPNGGDDDYVKKLEDELEIVTEQLIETEQRLTQSEESLAVAKAANDDTAAADAAAATNAAQGEAINKLKEEAIILQEELQKTKQELELNAEELTLTQDELKAAEDDVAAASDKIEEIKKEHRDELNQLRAQITEAQKEKRTSAAESSAVEETLQKTTAECEALQSQVEHLNKALENARQDQATVEKELEEVNARFDSVKDEAVRTGRESAQEEVRVSMSAAHDKDVAELKSQIKQLEDEKSSLQGKVDDTNMQLATMRDSLAEEKKVVETAQSEMVKELQDQLMRSKDLLVTREENIAELKNALETRVVEAEKQVSRLEKELSATKGQLAEAEAHLIVSKQQNRSSSTRRMAALGSDGSTSTPSVKGPSPRFLKRAKTTRRARSSSPISTERLSRRAEEQEKKAAELKKEYEDLKEQYRMGSVRTEQLEKDLRVLQEQMFAEKGQAVTQMSRISTISRKSSTAEQINRSVGNVDEVLQSGDPAKIAEELKLLDTKYSAQREYNSQLLSKILSLQGNIQVCCRVRPISLKEIKGGDKTAVEALSESELGCFESRTNKWKSFAFDRVWGPDETQQSIFQDVEPLALSVVDGYNACIFAYGQTGSGKTFTMEGSSENGNYGISYRTIQKIFHLLNLRAQQQKVASILGADEDAKRKFKFELRLGMLEIYNDEVYDLLGGKTSAGGNERLTVRKAKDGRVEVPDLTKKPISSIEDVMTLLKQGNANRATAATDLNEHSSRSHMVLLVDVKSGLEGQPGNDGTLFLVDLAGSERVRRSKVEGEQLKEAGHINKSLSALGNVMEALDRKAAHVPYRDSKLTYLLQDSLGGNSRTMMVVAVCPTNTSVDESIHALQFATRVRRIQIGAAQRNVTSKNLEETVKNLTNEMKKLSVAKEKSEIQLHSLKKDNSRIQERLQSISEQRKKSQAENRTLEVLRKNNSEMATRWQKEKTQREKTAEELEKAKTELRQKQSEVAKVTRERDSLTKQLGAKEEALADASRELRKAKDASAAANLRARKAEVIGSRNPRSVSAKSAASNKSAAARTKASAASAEPPASQAPSKAPTSAAKPKAPVDAAEVREQVLDLLKKYDQGKVDRIDVIMEKFKGKESLLVEKMKQRYEGGSVSAANAAMQKRSEAALNRHKERMKTRASQQ